MAGASDFTTESFGLADPGRTRVAGGGGAGVVVVGAGEARVERGDAVVEVAQGVDTGGAVAVVGSGEENCLAAEAVEESAEELEFVEAVLRAMEGVCGGGEVYGGRDSDDGVKLRRGCRA